MDSTLNIYGLLTKKMYYTYRSVKLIVAVKLSKNCKVYKVTATQLCYWKRGSSQEDGDVSMTSTLYMNS